MTTSASTVDVATYIEMLKRSQLIAQEKLGRTLQTISVTLSGTATGEDVAAQLVTSGMLTKWQSQQLLRGKYRGFQLGKYIIRRPLGRGGMGIVYEAEHSVLQTRVAIKILPKAKQDVEKAVSRFLAEARAAAKLSHPNVVRVHDCDVIDDRRFMVMELVDGADLGSVVEKQGPLSYRVGLNLLKQAASGLAYAHENGVTHRDVKPQNFLVNKEGTLKVADLGLALFTIDSPDRFTQDGNSMLGTVDYVAPEQAWDSRKVDPRADIYSLGCTFYFMLTGHPPFSSGTLAQRLAMHQTAQPRPLTMVRPDCPPHLWQLCLRMMAKKPHDRIQKMSEVVKLCDQLLARMPKGISDSKPSFTSSGSSDSHDVWSADSGGSNDFLNWNPQSFDGLVDASNAEANSAFFGASMPLANSAPPTSYAVAPYAASNNSPTSSPYWAVSAPAKKPSIKKQTASENSYTLIMLGVGLTLAIAALGMTVLRAFDSDDNKQDLPMIKQVEESDGSRVIIVNR